jgi:lipid A 3-O-deacylase
LLLAMAVPCGAAISQSTPSPRTLTLRVDNDAFDFWRWPWNRPDEDYTSGVHITYDGGDAPAWSRPFMRGRSACVARASSCRTGSAEIGQDIYTPALSADNPIPAPGTRPSAGWLYLASSARALTSSRSDEMALTIGVTGRPSLAEFTQTLVHRVAPAYNRPTDWSHQIGFEPGLIVRYEQRRRVSIVGGNAFGWDLLPRFGGSAGNVSTEADAGFQTRMGWHLPHPWLIDPSRVSVTVLAGASEKAVARDIFLDGTTFGHGPRVGHKPFVTSGEAGVELRYRWLNLTYRVQSDSRAYARASAWHPWASMVGGVTFDR